MARRGLAGGIDGRGWVDPLIIGAESLVVDVKQIDITTVKVVGDGQRFSNRRITSDWSERVVWGRQREGVLSKFSGHTVDKTGVRSYIAAFAVIVRGRLRFRHGSCIGIFVIDGG